jgi:glycerol-3-phosphate O-acyltransferase
MDLTGKFESSPWPEKKAAQVVFILDARNRFEQTLLEQWIRYRPPADASSEKITLVLDDDLKSVDSAPLAAALNRSEDTIVAPLRISWLPPESVINSGPRLRDFILGDPRRPNTKRGRQILIESPERMHLVAGQPDSLLNLQARYDRRHRSEKETRQESFATFTAQQAALVLDIAERRLQGGRYKVPRFVAESLQASRSYNQAVASLAQESGKDKADLMKEAATYMKEMISVPRTFWLDFYARFNNFLLGLGYEDKIVYDQSAVDDLRKIVRDHPSLLLWTHKTYLDGSVVPKVMYDNDFPMPHMFGGANMSFAGLGFLLRRSGAIFIRRSFQDNPLYKLTLRHYIGYLMEKRFPMNWAFEGTRSRMGKLMPPR